jgi:hypothetical protein
LRLSMKNPDEETMRARMARPGQLAGRRRRHAARGKLCCKTQKGRAQGPAFFNLL